MSKASVSWSSTGRDNSSADAAWRKEQLIPQWVRLTCSCWVSPTSLTQCPAHQSITTQIPTQIPSETNLETSPQEKITRWGTEKWGEQQESHKTWGEERRRNSASGSRWCWSCQMEEAGLWRSSLSLSSSHSQKELRGPAASHIFPTRIYSTVTLLSSCPGSLGAWGSVPKAAWHAPGRALPSILVFWLFQG